MTGTTQIACLGIFIDQRLNGFGTVGSRDACSAAVANEIDRYSKRGLV